ncbi:MAG: hypothetical protein P8013_12020 [Candidatus Sulfobium sp.]
MNDQNEKSRAICILGMHRSGTSAITRAINLLGVYLGEEKDIFPALDYNPEGLWERRDFNDLQGRLLAELKRTWDFGTPLPDGWQQGPEVKPFRDELVSLIKSNFSGVPLWGWKDPRSTIFIELWKDVLNELGIGLSVVFAVRNPLVVARSLQRRDGFSLDKGFGIWFSYNIAALRSIKDIPVAFISYDGFLDDWEQTLKRTTDCLAIEWPQDTAGLREKMASFIRPDLRHSESTGEDLKKIGAPDPVRELDGVLRRLLAGEPLGSSSNWTTAERLWEAFSSYARFYQYDMTEVWKRNETLALREEEVAERDRVLIQKGQELARREEQQTQKEKDLTEREQELIEKGQEFIQKGQQMIQKELRLTEKELQVTEREMQVAEANRQLRQVGEMARRLAELDGRLVEMERQLSEKDRRLTEKARLLDQREQRVHDLMNSLSWKITAPLRRLAEPFIGKIMRHH